MVSGFLQGFGRRRSERAAVSVPKNRVGIGMPVYNGERYLEQTLRATLAQTYADFHLIIADNASTDRTAEICRDFAATDSRIVYIRNSVNLGAARNYARCFEPSNSEYFRWANADDLPEPTLVEKCVNVLDRHPGTVMAYGKTKVIDAQGNLMQYYDDNLHLRQDRAADRFIACLERIGLNNVMYGLMRRAPLARTALLRNYIAADINLVVELTLYGKFYEIPEYLFSRRMHPHASSWDRANAERQRDFWDPSKRRLVMSTWRSICEYNKAVLRAPIQPRQKYALLRYLMRRTYRARNAMMRELADLLRYGVFARRSNDTNRGEQ